MQPLLHTLPERPERHRDTMRLVPGIQIHPSATITTNPEAPAMPIRLMTVVVLLATNLVLHSLQRHTRQRLPSLQLVVQELLVRYDDYVLALLLY
jgi:hypothetical protein